jgi:hypothetical protein
MIFHVFIPVVNIYSKQKMRRQQQVLSHSFRELIDRMDDDLGFRLWAEGENMLERFREQKPEKVIEYFKELLHESPSFFVLIHTDGMNRVEFWRTPESLELRFTNEMVYQIAENRIKRESIEIEDNGGFIAVYEGVDEVLLKEVGEVVERLWRMGYSFFEF